MREWNPDISESNSKMQKVPDGELHPSGPGQVCSISTIATNQLKSVENGWNQLRIIEINWNQLRMIKINWEWLK